MSFFLITCGPASTRIDDVRRITNFSTGELGTLLAEALALAGHEVICLRGEGATFRPPSGVKVESFFSNDDLRALLIKLSVAHSITHVLHAAALTDFQVAAITDAEGNPFANKKISSSIRALHIRLEPAVKVIGLLRELFPKAHLTGWKYELTGTRDEAFTKAAAQIATNQTDACVLNGAAYGAGFAWLTPKNRHYFPDKAALVQFLVQSAVGQIDRMA